MSIVKKQNTMKHNETEDLIYPEEASFLQFDSDYKDHTTAILQY